MQTGDKRQYIKNILILLLLVIFCSLSSYIYLKENKSIEYTLPTTNGIKTIEVAKGDIFEQDIKIHGSIDALSLFIANGGGNRVTINTGSIEFILQQGTVEESTILDINGIEDWTYVEIPINLSHFTTGMATLTIKGINTQIGSSIYLVYQVEDIYELPPLKYNGESLSGALFLKYETQNFGISFRNFVLFFSLSILLCLVLARFISLNKNNAAIYVLTSVLIFCLIALRYPSYTVGGEVWAEIGNLYVPSALSKSFLGNLIVLEANLYINILGRLITWFFVQIMPSLYWAVFSINVFSLILLSIMGASLSSGVFKKYISPLESVVLSILITTCMVDPQTIATPLITSYWAIIPSGSVKSFSQIGLQTLL